MYSIYILFIKKLPGNLYNYNLLNFRDINFIAVNKSNTKTYIPVDLSMQKHWSYLPATEVVKYYISTHLNIKETVFYFFHISI